MAFRNDREALEAKVRALEAENERLRARLEEALGDLEEGSTHAERLRAELQQARRFAAQQQPPTSTPRDRSSTRSYPARDDGGAGLGGVLLGGAVLAAVAASVIWKLTDGDGLSFVLYTGAFLLVLVGGFAIATYRAVRDFTKDWGDF